MSLNLELLAVSLTLALSIGGFVWASVLIEERKHRIRRARERAEGTKGKT